MLDFDAQIYDEVSKKHAYYQRYSDDIIIVCDQENEEYFYDLLLTEIEQKAKLDIQKNKIHVYRYELGEDETLKGGIVKDKVICSNRQLEYLGFTFDGNKVRVKTSGFSKFYRNMKHSFKRGVYFAKKAHIPSNSLFERRLYKRFTHVGARRRLKWIADSSSPTGYRRTTMYDWGNFISYLNKADAVMNDINKGNNIARQSRKIWKKFHEINKKASKEITRYQDK